MFFVNIIEGFEKNVEPNRNIYSFFGKFNTCPFCDTYGIECILFNEHYNTCGGILPVCEIIPRRNLDYENEKWFRLDNIYIF